MEIVNKIDPNDKENEYVEMSYEEYLDKLNLSENERIEKIKSFFAINIHCLVSLESYDRCLQVLNDRLIDPRLTKMNAIVFLSLKQKGRGTNFHPLSDEKFKNLINIALEKKINIGFDSCSCQKFMSSVVGHPNYKQFEQSAEPCEAVKFSAYSNVDGDFFPCSFCDGVKKWNTGLSILNCNDFIKDIWYNSKTIEFRDELTKLNRNCPMFKI